MTVLFQVIIFKQLYFYLLNFVHGIVIPPKAGFQCGDLFLDSNLIPLDVIIDLMSISFYVGQLHHHIRYIIFCYPLYASRFNNSKLTLFIYWLVAIYIVELYLCCIWWFWCSCMHTWCIYFALKRCCICCTIMLLFLVNKTRLMRYCQVHTCFVGSCKYFLTQTTKVDNGKQSCNCD